MYSTSWPSNNGTLNGMSRGSLRKSRTVTCRWHAGSPDNSAPIIVTPMPPRSTSVSLAEARCTPRMVTHQSYQAHSLCIRPASCMSTRTDRSVPSSSAFGMEQICATTAWRGGAKLAGCNHPKMQRTSQRFEAFQHVGRRSDLIAAPPGAGLLS